MWFVVPYLLPLGIVVIANLGTKRRGWRLLTYLGLAALNMAALILFVILQLARARMEEEKLKRNFPLYEEYASKVWWVWKG